MCDPIGYATMLREQYVFNTNVLPITLVTTRNSAIAQTARVGGHYSVQGHSRSLSVVPIESPHMRFPISE